MIYFYHLLIIDNVEGYYIGQTWLADSFNIGISVFTLDRMSFFCLVIVAIGYLYLQDHNNCVYDGRAGRERFIILEWPHCWRFIVFMSCKSYRFYIDTIRCVQNRYFNGPISWIIDKKHLYDEPTGQKCCQLIIYRLQGCCF